MAFFIVIGTNNDVKCVVDEVKNAHLRHNVITSGCILHQDDGLYYEWEVFNEQGEKEAENKEVVRLQDALTNQISQFRTLLPEDAIPNVFIVSSSFTREECDTLRMVCDELCQIRGARLGGLLVDIVLLGYDINKPNDVTIRPHWRLLESIGGFSNGGCFHTNVLYINNMDYMGAATNIDARILGRFLCHWSKMVCTGGYDPKSIVHSHVYSIGMSEHQYDVRDLNDFFKISAEEKILGRRLDSLPSPDTQELLDTNYFAKIDLDLPWLDGLLEVSSRWEQYCSTSWDSSKPLDENTYSVSKQELVIASFLNSFLELYISEEKRIIDGLQIELDRNEANKAEFIERLGGQEELSGNDEGDDVLKDSIDALDSEIDNINNEIRLHEENIERNTFVCADEFYERFRERELITEEDEEEYDSSRLVVEELTSYVKSEDGIRVMREAIERATVMDILPDSYPASEVLNIGRVLAITPALNQTSTIPQQSGPCTKQPQDNPGCLVWFMGLFRKDKSSVNVGLDIADPGQLIADDVRESLDDMLSKAVSALQKADRVRSWWDQLQQMIDSERTRREECRLLMDGESCISGEFVLGKEGFAINSHRKSTSLIDMNRVRHFRDTDTFYRQNVNKFIDCWFDKSIDIEERMTMPELIKCQIIDPIVGAYHTLKWDGSNPFVNENITDAEIHAYIEHDLNQSKPFVEYVRVPESNLASNLSVSFFSNNQNIPAGSEEFRTRYNISAESLMPVYLNDFVNSLCVVQVMDIPDHVEALMDFRPRREYRLGRLSADIQDEAIRIVGDAITVEEKARAIYNWICDNISYDTTRQIHDAEACYRTRMGVCQAYCELFCLMADAVGVTSDVIVGKTKDQEGKICDDAHSWVFVYTHAYEGILIDPTWGAGSVDGVSFIRSHDHSKWFDVSPYWMVFSHLPNNPCWLRLDMTVTKEQFAQLPVVEMTGENNGRDVLFECLSRI